jgi:hypothetical protein
MKNPKLFIGRIISPHRCASFLLFVLDIIMFYKFFRRQAEIFRWQDFLMKIKNKFHRMHADPTHKTLRPPNILPAIAR